jgi:hypothetical protein
MEYKKAYDVFPQALVDEMQRYAEGCIVYIPKRSGNRAPWGAKTKIRTDIARRNSCIRSAFKRGTNIIQLSEQYFLSPETIRKIVYTK